MQREFSTKTLIYLRAAELIEKGHCKSAIWRDDDLRACSFEDATHYCYHGAIAKALNEITGAEPFTIKAFPEAYWNDAPETTAAMVAARLREEAFK